VTDRLFSFRWDVDHRVCITDGLPRIRAVCRDFGVPNTFFVNLGRSTNLREWLGKGITRSKAKLADREAVHLIKKTGWPRFLVETALARPVGLRFIPEIQALQAEGHELGLHGGMDHVVWSRRFDRGSGIGDQGSSVTVVHSPEAVADQADILTVHLALASDTRNLVNRSLLDRLKPGSYFVNTSRAEVVDHGALADAVRSRGIRVALDVFANEPAASTGEFIDPLLTLPGVIGTHHIGASTEQAQEAIAAEAARIVRVYKETGKVPNVVNLATTTPATHMLVVRHRDRPGVLAHVFDHLRAGNLNVQETENVVFEGAEAAIARINLDREPPAALLATIAGGNQDILNLYLVKI